MRRVVASLPDEMPELCLVRLGIVAKKLSGLLYVRKLTKKIDESSRIAIVENAGLRNSERMAFSLWHFGVLQYWESFEALETWSHRPPHSEWWRDAVQRSRNRPDFGIYHEAFLVPRDKIESIYLDSPPFGLASFGTLGDAVGPMTTGRDRLGLRKKER